jgi:hypothetical protein
VEEKTREALRGRISATREARGGGAMLEKGELLDYTAIPNFEKLGFEIMAFTFASGSHNEKVDELISKSPNLIFVSSGRGLGMNRAFISLHKDYSDYAKFVRELESKWGKHPAKLDNFIISLKSDNIPRQVSFKHLADHLKKKEK